MFERGLIGMVHVGALPTAPKGGESVRALRDRAVAEARIIADAGFDAVMIENMHDAPYLNGPHDPSVVASMAIIAQAVREALPPRVHLGVQVLSRGEHEALAIAHACGASFIRCECFVFSHVADEGLMAQAAAGPLLRARARLGATNIRIFADIQKKHASHALTSDLTLADCAHGAAFFGADGLIVTGTATGKATDVSHVAAVRKASSLPVLVGSGVTPQQVPELLENANALIVGSFIKRGGLWSEPVDPERCKALVRARDARA